MTTATKIETVATVAAIYNSPVGKFTYIPRKYGEQISLWQGFGTHGGSLILGLEIRGGNMTIHMTEDEARQLADALLAAVEKVPA